MTKQKKSDRISVLEAKVSELEKRLPSQAESTPTKWATFNHTRDDSPLLPCKECASTDIERNMADVIADLRQELAGTCAERDRCRDANDHLKHIVESNNARERMFSEIEMVVTRKNRDAVDYVRTLLRSIGDTLRERSE